MHRGHRGIVGVHFHNSMGKCLKPDFIKERQHLILGGLVEPTKDDVSLVLVSLMDLERSTASPLSREFGNLRLGFNVWGLGGPELFKEIESKVLFPCNIVL